MAQSICIQSITKENEDFREVIERKNVPFSRPGPLGPATPTNLLDLWDFKIWSFNLDIGVDARGPETEFTIEKKKTYKVVTKWSVPSGHKVVIKK